MVRSVFKYLSIFLLNTMVLLQSKKVDVEQLMDDLSFITVINIYDKNLMILTISIFVTLFTSMLLKFFQPFIEVYLMYYFKLSFYLLINLLSISTIYLITRVYGYSRLNIILYLLFSSIFIYAVDRKN